MAGNHVSHQCMLVRWDPVSKTGSETQAELLPWRWDMQFLFGTCTAFCGRWAYIYTINSGGNWVAVGGHSDVDSQLPCSSAVSRLAKTSYKCGYKATRHQKEHRQQTGQYRRSRIWARPQIQTCQLCREEKTSGSCCLLVWVQAHI